MNLVARVVARFLQAEDGEEKKPGKGGVPARWQEFLDKVHHGGKERVKNPNPKTQSRHKEVAYSTALKYPKFFLEAMKEYNEWAKKNPKDKGEGGAKGKAPEEKPKSRTPLPEAIKDAVTRVFGDNPPSVEDFEEMFSVGKDHKTKITKIRHVKGAVTNDFDFEGDPAEHVVRGSVEVNYEIHDKDGKVIGHGAQNFNTVDGEKVVFNQEVKLDEKSQGQGLGKTMLKNNFTAFKKMGVKKSMLNADWKGRYVWPRMGYDSDPDTVNAMKDDLRKHLRTEVGISKAAADKILDACKTLHDISSVRVDGEHAGKDFLLSKRARVFSASISLDDDDPGFKILKEYVGL